MPRLYSPLASPRPADFLKNSTASPNALAISFVERPSRTASFTSMEPQAFMACTFPPIAARWRRFVSPESIDSRYQARELFVLLARASIFPRLAERYRSRVASSSLAAGGASGSLDTIARTKACSGLPAAASAAISFAASA